MFRLKKNPHKSVLTTFKVVTPEQHDVIAVTCLVSTICLTAS